MCLNYFGLTNIASINHLIISIVIVVNWYMLKYFSPSTTQLCSQFLYFCLFPLDSIVSKSSYRGCISHLGIHLKPSFYGRFEIYRTNQNSSWKKIHICFYFWYSLNSILANVYAIVCPSDLVLHVQSTTTAAAGKLLNKRSA